MYPDHRPAHDKPHEAEMDYPEHERTYRAFIRYARVAAVGSPLLLAFVVYWTH